MSEHAAAGGDRKGLQPRASRREVQVLRGATLTVARGRGGGAGGAVGGGEVDAAAHRGAAGHAGCGARACWTGATWRGLGDRARTEARRGRGGVHLPVPPSAAGVHRAGERGAAAAGRTGWPRPAAEARARELLERVGVGRGRSTARRRCRGASSSGWPFAGRWPMGRSCCWRMSRPGTLIPATSDQVFGVLMELVRETGLCGADRHA